MYQIIYDSRSGNTKKLAEHIYRYLDGEARIITSVMEFDEAAEADLYFAGFYTNRNSCSMEFAEMLEELKGKKIALFGTCGMGNTTDYYEKIRNNIEVWMPEEYEDCGFFMCQGKMSDEIKDKINAAAVKMPENVKYEVRQLYNTGLTHPDEEDLRQLERFVDNVTGK